MSTVTIEEKGKKTRNAGCAKCAWRLVEQTGTAGKHYHCGYSLCYGHHSRVWLHYQRTGRESLEGMTFGENCTEFLTGNPEDKKTLLQDNPSRISEKAWKLLAKEFGEDQRKTEKKVKETRSRTDMVEIDMDKATKLRGKHTWREIAETVGMTINGTKGCWERQRIKQIAAQRLKDAYGVDITKADE